MHDEDTGIAEVDGRRVRRRVLGLAAARRERVGAGDAIETGLRCAEKQIYDASSVVSRCRQRSPSARKRSSAL